MAVYYYVHAVDIRLSENAVLFGNGTSAFLPHFL